MQKSETGQTLLERVCQHVQIVAHERDYFGLRYMDLNKNRVSFICWIFEMLLFAVLARSIKASAKASTWHYANRILPSCALLS